jgi:hypothetical protein
MVPAGRTFAIAFLVFVGCNEEVKMKDELDSVMAEVPAPVLNDFPRVSRGTDPVPEIWHVAMKDADGARRLFAEKRYESAAEKYLAVAAALPESASIGIYGGEFASARAVAYQNAAISFKSGGLATLGKQKLSKIQDAGAKDGLAKALRFLE